MVGLISMATAIIQQQITLGGGGYFVIPTIFRKTLNRVTVRTGPHPHTGHICSLQYPDKTLNGQRETMQTRHGEGQNLNWNQDFLASFFFLVCLVSI